MTKHQRVMTYTDPYGSIAYEMDATGHGWDRLASIAGEYECSRPSGTTPEAST